LLLGRTGEALIEQTAKIDPTAAITGGSYIGHNAVVGANVLISGSVIFTEVIVGSGTQITNSIVSTAAHIGTDCHVVDTVIAERATIIDGKNLEAGSLVFPDELVS
jgi:mannose-1-phosphate guanylyltransferase